MAEYTNSKGEPSPALAKCTLTMRAVESDPLTNAPRRFTLDDVTLDGVPIRGIDIVTRGAAVKFDVFERGDIPVSRSIENVAQKAAQGFVYLDVGLWGDNLVQSGPAGELRQRNFAIVHHDLVVLCSFWAGMMGLLKFVRGDQDTKYFERQYEKYKDVYALLAHLAENYFVEVHKVVECRPSWLRNEHPEPVAAKRIYVLLPDLHLPVARNPFEVRTSTVAEQKINRAGWDVERRREIKYVAEPSMGRWKSADESLHWYERYQNGDIFKKAGPDLAKFLATLRTFKQKKKLGLVQLGDMYDLWIGLARCFDEAPAGMVRLTNGKMSWPVRTENDPLQVRDEGFTSFDFVKYWIERTHQTNPEVAKSFSDIMGEVETYFLSGNHDDYLVHDAVYPPDPAGYRKMVFDLLGQTRTRELHDDGLFMEHGHFLDATNRDGATDGHGMTQNVFE